MMKAFAAVVGAALVAAPVVAQCGPPDEPGVAVRESLLVQPAWLASRLNDPRLVILHIGEREGYEAGHIPGARLVNAHGFSAGHHDLPSAAVLDALIERLGVSNDSRVVLYGDAWMTGWMYLVFDYLGHGERTAVLNGGLDAWRAGNHPLSRQAPPPRTGTFTPRLRSDIVVDAGWVRARLGSRDVAIIDTRTAEEYAGTMREELPRRGHITGATLLSWERTFTRPTAALQGATSPLIAARDLRTLLETAGATNGRTPVFYCTVGMRASHLYFVARYLGYDPKIYDGSMVDWSAQSGNPMTSGTSQR